jgi:hypothetical protein
MRQRRSSDEYGERMTTRRTERPNLTPVSAEHGERRLTEREAELAVLALVRAMGENDLLEGLSKLEMLQVIDDLRCDWMEVLQHGLPELTPKPTSPRAPRLVHVRKRED